MMRGLQQLSKSVLSQISAIVAGGAFWMYWDSLHGTFTIVSYLLGLVILGGRALWHYHTRQWPIGYRQTQLFFFFYHTMLHVVAWVVTYLILE